jgi:hypothetical protein
MRALRRAISAAFFSGVYCPGWSLARNSPRFTRASLFLYVASCFFCEWLQLDHRGRTLPKEKAEDRPLSRALWKNWDGPSKKPSGAIPAKMARQSGGSWGTIWQGV